MPLLRYICACIACLILLALPNQAHGAEEPKRLSPDDVTAVLLWKFSQFTQWPDTSSNTNEPFRIVVLSRKNGVAEALAPYVDKTVQGRRVQVSHVKRFNDVGNPDILYVGTSSSLKPQEQQRMIEQHTMICSTKRNFASNGGMVQFVLIDGKSPQFEINQASLRKAELEVRAGVLTLARKVYGIPILREHP